MDALEIHNALKYQHQLEEEHDDESTGRNFQKITRDADLSPRENKKGGKKIKRREDGLVNRVMPKRANSKIK